MLLTVLVKLIVFPLVHRSIKIQAKSSAEMKRIKPHLEAINEKYKEDPQEKQRQTWKVYQEHGINPLGAMRSCLPILPQIPIFIGLYRIANDTIDLQGAKFLWINDLSQADHLVHLGGHIPLIGSYFNILPILVAVTQMLSSKIAIARTIHNITDPNQIQMQKMMVYLIPVMVMVTMYHFPAGLMLYWMASNIWQIGQTLITNKILDREEEKHLKAGPPPRKAKKPMDPNSFMGKMMARAEAARKEMERREQLAKKGGAPSGKKRR
jgi:YidC/Oxa1 family membrane protein insertase